MIFCDQKSSNPEARHPDLKGTEAFCKGLVGCLETMTARASESALGKAVPALGKMFEFHVYMKGVSAHVDIEDYILYTLHQAWLCALSFTVLPPGARMTPSR